MMFIQINRKKNAAIRRQKIKHFLYRYVCGVLLLFVLAQSSYAQNKFSYLTEKIRYPAKSSSVTALLEALQQQSGYSFFFDKNELNKVPLRGLSFTETTLGKVLFYLQEQAGFEFMLNKKSIAVTRRPGFKNSAASLSPSKNGKIKETVYPFILTGQVTDLSTGTPLSGATVIIKGTATAMATDSKGYYKIRVPGKGAVLVVGFIGYENSQVIVEGGGGQDIKLASTSISLNGVSVTASRRVSTETALLNDRKNSAVVSDGISAQNIERTASITTAQALQRVTGVTITDDKYVAVRGLGDRSVIAELNGARLSSADPDRSVVPIDLIPASLLDNITVYKTQTPDHPADATAGLIELKTKSIPSALSVQLSASVGTNTEIGLRGYVNSFSNSDMGFFGNKIKKKDLSQDFLNLQNQYPGGLVQIQRLFIESRASASLTKEANRINNIMLSFDPVMAASYKIAQPDQVYNISLGNTFNVFGGHKLGLILGANYYRRTRDRYLAELNHYSIYQGIVTGTFRFNPYTGTSPYIEYTPKIYNPLTTPAYTSPNDTRLGKYLGYKESSGTEELSYGALAGVTYRFNDKNEIQFQYMGSRGGETDASTLSGSYQNTGLQYPVYDMVNQLRQTYRIFNTYNIQGEHKLNVIQSSSTLISYNASSSKSKQDEPDFRFTEVAHEQAVSYIDASGQGIGNDIYGFVIGSVYGIGSKGVIGADPNKRNFRNLTETNYNAKLDIQQSFKISNLEQIIKAGGNYLYRNRTYNENLLGIPGTNPNNSDSDLLATVKGDVNKLVSSNYIGYTAADDNLGAPRVGGFLYQVKKSANNYTGSYETNALYVMADLHLSTKLRLTGGVRFETTDIETTADTANVDNPLTLVAGQTNTPSTVSTTSGVSHIVYSRNFTPYYSANITYALKPAMNLRLGFSTSLARPELREMANVYEFDPFQFAVILGNPSLINQSTKSEDIRWEWFPDAGEVVSASFFAKQIEHQLNKMYIFNSQGITALYPQYPIIKYQNDPNTGYLYGVELELRKSLGKWWRSLQNFYIGTNLMGAYSSVVKSTDRLNAARTNDRYSPEKSPVFEQPPYLINAYLDYESLKTGTNITGSFNIVGERLIQIQMDGTPDIYERPAPLLDIVFRQKLGKRFQFKGYAKNILNPPFRQVYTNPGNNGKFYGKTYIYHQYYKGAEFSLGLTYILK